mmetsp:Transcript_20570/g.26646  ORF Transcript_20570/g.26646 Transcript_20570/m.26646 type:complete len:303 (+) Transcript_20570:73-981(+)
MGNVLLENVEKNFSVARLCFAILISAYLGYNGRKKKSLNLSGSIAAVFVGFVSFSISVRFGVILILFYKSSSILTKYKGDEKKQLDDHSLEGGQRNYIQVFSCSLIACVVAIVFLLTVGNDCAIDFENSPTASALLCAYIGHYACANGDTWASELGVLSQGQPRLITTLCLRKVPPGTNGGISWMGTIASILGGAFIGLGFHLMAFLVHSNQGVASQIHAVTLGSFAGLFGSMVDSLLGATVQSTYYDKDKKCVTSKHPKDGHEDSIEHICGMDILSNEQVNIVSVFLTTILCGVYGNLIFR